MGLAKELFKEKRAKELVKELLDNKAQNIADKGTNMSNTDLYNLCLINKERDEIGDA